MKTLAIALLLSLAISATLTQETPLPQQQSNQQADNSQCLQQSIMLSISQCQISYKLCSNRYELVTCKKRQNCISGNIKSCTQYQWTQFYNAYDCMANCCDMSINQINQGAINQCAQLDNQKTNQAVTTIVSSVVGCITVSIALYCIYQKLCRRRQNDNQPQNVKSKKQIQQNSHAQWQVSTKVVHEDLKIQSCVICLDVDPEAITSCDHKFHLKCLIEWVKKRNVCPICINKKINPVRIQCGECFQKEKIFKITKKTSYSEAIKKQLQSHCGCKQNQ